MKLTISHGKLKRAVALVTKPQFSPEQMATLVKGARKHLTDTLEDPGYTAWLDTPIKEK